MKPWFLRFVTLLFVVSMFATPLTAAGATDEGVPVASPEAVESSAVVNEPPATPEVITPTEQPLNELAPLLDPLPSSGFNGFVTVPRPTFDLLNSTLRVSFTMENGFAALAGDQIRITYEPEYLNLDVPWPGVAVGGVTGAYVTVDPALSQIIITFNLDYTPAATPTTVTTDLPATVTFGDCWPSVDGYIQEIFLWFVTPTESEGQVVFGNACPPLAAPEIYDVYYDAVGGVLNVSLLIPGDPVEGQQLTLTYDPAKLAVDAGPFMLTSQRWGPPRSEPVGSATASNGVITITLHERADGEWSDDAWVDLPATLVGACDSAAGPYLLPAEDLIFTTEQGRVFTENVPGMVCNAVAASKQGELSTNSNGDSIIIWTIDTGDVLSHVHIVDYANTGFTFDCGDGPMDIHVTSGEATVTTQWCTETRVDVGLESANGQPFRAVFTVAAAIDETEPTTSWVNCAEVSVPEANANEPYLANTNGLGGTVCYELFPEGGGDTVTKTVDKAVAQPGDTLTYTINASTTSDSWSWISITDPLPAGFAIDPASVSCTVVPDRFASDPCYTLVSGELRVLVVPEITDLQGGWYTETGPVSVTLTFSGTVTAAPGETITNTVHSLRAAKGGQDDDFALFSVGDPTIPGGGLITASAITVIPAAETPTVPATPEPTDPVVTPTATATTPAVTDLPDTGVGRHDVDLLFGLLAASMVAGAAVGMRIRTALRN